MPISEGLQPKETEYLKYLKGKGINAQDSFSRLENARTKGLFGQTDIQTPEIKKEVPKVEKTGIFGNIKKGLQSFGADISKIQRGGLDDETGMKKGLLGRSVSGLKERGENVKLALHDYNLGKQGLSETFYQIGGQNVKGIVDVFGDAFMSGLSTVTEEEAKKMLKEKAIELSQTEGGEFVMGKLEQAQKDMEFLKENDPEAYRNFQGTFAYLEGISEAIGLGQTSKVIKKSGTGIISKTIKKVDEFAEKVIKTEPAKLFTTPKKPSTKIEGILERAKKRIETGPQEFKGKVGEKPTITPVKPEISKKILKEQTKKVESLNKAFTPMQKVRDGRVVRPQEKIDSQWTKILDDFEKKGIKPTDMKDFRKNMIQGQKDIYKVIDPAIAKSKVNIDLNDVVSDVRRNIPENAEILSKGQVKQIDDMVGGILDDPKYRNMNMEKLEELKQFVNSITDYNAQGQDKVLNNFLKDFSYKIGDLQDNVLGKIEGQSTIKDLKRTYGAYSDMLGDVNKSIIKYDRKAPIGLFSGFGRIAGLGNIIEGVVKGDLPGALKGGVQLTTGEVIKNINDANNIIRRTFKETGKTFKGTPKSSKPLQKKPLKLREKITPKKPIVVVKKKPLAKDIKSYDINKKFPRTAKSIKTTAKERGKSKNITQSQAKVQVKYFKNYFKKLGVEVDESKLGERMFIEGTDRAIHGAYTPKLSSRGKPLIELGKVRDITIPHEYTHAYLDLAISNKEKKELFNEISKTFKLKRPIDIEEFLANKIGRILKGDMTHFGKMSNNAKQVIGKIIDAIKKMFGKNASIKYKKLINNIRNKQDIKLVNLSSSELRDMRLKIGGDDLEKLLDNPDSSIRDFMSGQFKYFDTTSNKKPLKPKK